MDGMSDIKLLQDEITELKRKNAMLKRRGDIWRDKAQELKARCDKLDALCALYLTPEQRWPNLLKESEVTK